MNPNAATLRERADALMKNESISWIGTAERLYRMVIQLIEENEQLRADFHIAGGHQ